MVAAQRNTTYSKTISAISIILMASKIAEADQGPLKEAGSL